MITAQTDTRAFATALEILGKEVLPEIVAQSLNETAEAVTRRGRHNIKKELIVRTKYTTNSLTNRRAKPYDALGKAFGHDIDRMFSMAGTFSPYLGVQSTGGTTEPATGGVLPIPHKNIRTGESKMKAIAKRYRLSASEKLRPGHVGTLTGDRYFVGRPKGGKYDTYGLYERGYNNKRLRFHRNLEHEKAKIPATNWHSEAVDRMGNERLIRARFKRAAQRRLSKFRGRRL